MRLLLATAAAACTIVPLYFLVLVFSGDLAINPFGAEVADWVKWQALVMGLMGASVAIVFWRIATGARG